MSWGHVKRFSGTRHRQPVLRRCSALGPQRGLGRAWRQRRISVNTCGVISLTLLIGSVARGLDLQPRQEIDEPTEVVIAKMGSARADLHPRIVGHDIGPLERKPGELS